MDEQKMPRRPRRSSTEEQPRNESLVYGKNPVTELLKSGSGVDTVLIAEGMAPAVAAYYTAMAKEADILEVDNAHLTFTDEALELLARHAFEANEFDENLGARRLVAVMEKLLDEIAFDADGEEKNINIDADFVIQRLGEGAAKRNLDRYIL